MTTPRSAAVSAYCCSSDTRRDIMNIRAINADVVQLMIRVAGKTANERVGL